MTSLKKYIQDNPHILENRDRIQGVLSDYFSGDKITVKRLMKGYDNDIIDVLNEENVDEDTKNRFIYKLVRKEDLIQDVAIEIFDEWADLLGKELIPIKNNAHNDNEGNRLVRINETLNDELAKEDNYIKQSNDSKKEITKSQSIKAIVYNNVIMKFYNYIFIICYVVATVTSVLVFIVGLYLTKEETQGLPGVIFQLICLPIFWLIFKKKFFKAYIAFILSMGLLSLLMIVVYYKTLFSEWFKGVRVLYIICTISAICVVLQLFINKVIKNN